MTRYTEDFKQALVKKLMMSSLSYRQFSKLEGVSISTLHCWKEKYQIRRGDESKCSPPSITIAPEQWAPEEKFTTVLESIGLSEIELGGYCRSKGIYPEQLKLWRQSCIQGAMTNSEHKKQAALDAKADKKRIKELERELRKKDKALAEAAALLLLQKKFNALLDDEGS